MPLTEKDLKAIEQLLEIRIDRALEERLQHFPSREELFDRLDEIVTELQATRQEMAFQSHKIRDHEDRIQVLEDSEAKA